MRLIFFRATDFRCLSSIEFEPDPDFSLVVGPNASGKTSLLEAIAYLGRGRSFRSASTAEVTRHGEKEFVLFGKVQEDDHVTGVGVRNSAAGLEVHVGGEAAAGAAALAETLPLQVIDPEVHDLVGGAPENRRKYLDWIAFHVEPGYLETWRRFRRTLRQRNAALRDGVAAGVLAGWTEEFVLAAERLDAGRRRALALTEATLEATVGAVFEDEVAFGYEPGWNAERGLERSLEAGAERERQVGSTQVGPHRADLRISFTARRARSVVSRGQEKLLASAMLLAATETAQDALGKPMLLLLDDPAAELDAESLRRLLERVLAIGCQVIATSLDAALPVVSEPALFHVEHGRLARAGD